MFARMTTVSVIACTAAALTAIDASSLGGPEFFLPLDDAAQVAARNVSVKAVDYRGSPALEVRRLVSGAAPDIDTFAFVPSFDFHNGTIEIELAGSPLPDAPPGARGFVGVVFRVQTSDGSFATEGIYVCARPTAVRRTKFGAITQRSISRIQVTTLLASAARHRANTSPTST